LSLFIRPGYKGTAMRKTVTSIIIAIILIASAAPAVAASVAGFLAGTGKGSYYLYDYQQLLDSYALKLIGNPNGLYEHFSSKFPVAFLHRDGVLVDYKDTINHYAAMVLAGRKFDFAGFATSPASQKIGPPTNLYRVHILQGRPTSQRINNNSHSLISAASTPTVPDAPAATPLDVPVASGRNSEADGIPIVAASRVTLERAVEWAAGKNAHPRFIEIAALYWEFGRRTGISPEVLYAQSALETGYGHFTGQVPPNFNNWAGIKTANATGDEPKDHDQFATPEDGVRAHFNHMAAYVGLHPIGELHDRFFVVKRLPWAGTIRSVEELSGKWAPAATYHQSIVRFLSEMGH